MVKAKKNSQKIQLKTVGYVVAVVMAILTGAVLYAQQQRLSRLTDLSNLREMVFLAIDNVKSPAPVDAKSGHTYFPQANLVLARQLPSIQQKLTYNADPEDVRAKVVLSVSSELLINTLKSKAMNAQTQEEFFEQLPHLQACSRGIAVTYEQLKPGEDEEILRDSIQLSNGKTAYIYSENACPELNDLVNDFKNLQAY